MTTCDYLATYNRSQRAGYAGNMRYKAPLDISTKLPILEGSFDLSHHSFLQHVYG